MRLLPLLMLPLLCCGLTRSPTQGSASLDQTRLAKRSFVKAKAIASLPALPQLLVAPKPTLYFSATASSTNGESDYSVELSTNKSPVTLAWDASPSPGITNHNVYVGRTSQVYTVHFPSGTNLTLKVPPPALTNLVVTVAGLVTNWSGTNPPGMRLWRGTNLTISKRYQ
jgi:hypothetical protein